MGHVIFKSSFSELCHNSLKDAGDHVIFKHRSVSYAITRLNYPRQPGSNQPNRKTSRG